MSRKIRPIIQILSFVIFIALMILGKAQFWMALIFLSIFLSTFFGRFYCGWICPINTLLRPVRFISKKLGLQKSEVPDIFKREKIRWFAFTLFLVGLGYTIYTITQGRKFPLPAIIIPIGILTTLFINEKTWHRYLCPWGVLFSMTGKFAKLGISPNGCVSCKACEKTCPGDAIVVDKKNGAFIDSTHCLVCLECQKSCPVNALQYKKRNP